MRSIRRTPPRPACPALIAVAIIAAASTAHAFDIDGVARTSADEPVADARVWLVASDQSVADALTDASGAFCFSDVRPGEIVLVAYKEGLALGGIRAQAVGPDTVHLEMPEPAVASLRVVSSRFDPIEGARAKLLVVSDRFHLEMDALAAKGFPSLRSDRQGLLEIPFLPQGGYAGCLVAHRDFAENYMPHVAADGRIRTIQLYPGIPLRGRVTNEDGAGVPAAHVAAIRTDTAAKTVPHETRTDPEGFYFAMLRPGSYMVSARHPDYAIPQSRPVRLRASEPEPEPADITLPSAHRVTGRILDPDGAPFPGVWVDYRVGGRLYRRVMSMEDGAYAIPAPAGPAVIRVIPPDGFVVDGQLDINVDVPADGGVEAPPIRLAALPVISGTILDPDGQPAPHVLLSTHDMDPPSWAISDDTGVFRLRLARMPYTAEVTLRAEHAMRFWRADFTVDMTRLDENQRIRLQPFEPDISPNDPERARNNLGLLVDRPAPPLLCPTWINADPVHLDELRGRVVMLTLWGGFAQIGDVRNRMEEMRALHALFDGVPDVAFIAVHDSGVTLDLAAEYVELFGLPFPVGYDSEAADTFDRYHVTVIPQTVLIDKQGVVRYYDVDGRLLELIKALRRESGPATP